MSPSTMKNRGAALANYHTKVGNSCQDVARSFDESTAMSPQKPLPYIQASNVTPSWLGKLLGSGKFGQVREVQNRKTNTIMAVKELHSDFFQKNNSGPYESAAQDLVVEAKILNSLQHDNIIQLYGISCPQDAIDKAFSTNGGLKLYMERLYGGTVDDKIKAWRRSCANTTADTICLLKERLSTVALPAARAMSYLHSLNILYRDLKPQNMGFSKDGTLKLFDFGIARELHTDPNNRNNNNAFASRQLMGTPEYMAPEAIQKDCGLKADVFSFAIVLYQVVTLKRIEPLSLQDWFQNVVHGNVRSNIATPDSSIPETIQTLIVKCWSKSPQDRPSFSQIVQELEQHLQDEDNKSTKQQKKNVQQRPSSLHKKVANAVKKLNRSRHGRPPSGLNLSRHKVHIFEDISV